MQYLEDIVNLKPRVEPHKFLKFLTSVAKRTEAGHTHSISIGECKKWGFSADEVVPYLLLLVEAGILEQKVQIYDYDDDAFEDYHGQIDLSSAQASQVKIWFKPKLSGGDFSFFLRRC